MSPILKIIRRRRGAPWSEEDDRRLMDVGHLPPKVVADTMGRSWLACRRRLAYLRTGSAAEGSGGRRD